MARLVGIGQEFRRVVQPALKQRNVELAEQIGARMAELANNYVRENFKERVYERRRHPGSRRAAGSIGFKLVSKDPAQVDFTVAGGENVLKRVSILNYGRPDTVIESSVLTGNEPWPLKGVFTENINRFQRGQAKDVMDRPVLAWRQDNGGLKILKNGRVVSRGVQATNFLQESRDKAVREVLAGRRIQTRAV